MSEEDYVNDEEMEESYDEEHEEHQEHGHHGYHGHQDYEDVLNAQKITMADVKEHVTGPIISFLVHVALIFVLWNIIVFEPVKQKDDVEVDVSEVEIKELEEIPEPPEPPEEMVEEAVDIDIESPTVSTTETAVDMESAVSDMAVEDVSIDVDIPDVMTVQETESALKLPKTFSARTGTARAKALRKYGGGAHTERAVKKALKWLVEHQNDDGSWGAANDMKPVFTATALLAFLAHGETPMSAEYGQTIIKGIQKLLLWADDMAYHRRRCIPGPTYTHPIIVYALAEAYGITKMGKVKRALEFTIRPCIDYINKDGFYYYNYDNKIYKRMSKPFDRSPITGRYPLEKPPLVEYVHSDLTFSCWNYQALKAAYAAGCESEGLEDVLKKSAEALKKMPLSPKDDFTFVCLRALCMGLLGEGNTKQAKALEKFIEDFNKIQLTECDWKYNKEIMKVYPRSYLWAMYTWYYQTQVLFQITKGKGGLWTKWNRAFSNEFVKQQEADGSFSSPAEKYGKEILGKGTAAEWSGVVQFKNKLDLALYCTTFACLTLEVYYRYLPTYKLERDKAPQKKASLTDDEYDLKFD